MEPAVIIFLIFIISVTLWKLNKVRRTYNLMSKFPHPPTTPIVGNLWEMATNNQNSLVKKWVKICPNVACIWYFFTPLALLVHNVKDVEMILSNSNLIYKNYPYKLFASWIGSGIVTNSGKTWKPRRKLLSPAFKFRILENFIPLFNKHSEILVEILKEYKDKPSCDVFPLFSLCTLDMICETTMGIELDAQINSKSEYVEALEELKKLLSLRLYMFPFLPEFLFCLIFRRYVKCLKIIHEFADKVIKDRKAEIQDIENKEFSDNKQFAFLDVLINNGGILSDTDIRDEVNTLIFGGHDTTAVTLSWAVFFLGNHQSIQDKVHMELDSIFGEDKFREPTLQDLNQMKYLECVLKETLRLVPPGPLMTRELPHDIEIDGKTVPAGMHVTVNLIGLHRDPTAFPDPEKFDPDRFRPENSINRHPYAYAPFMAGARSCIGQRYGMLQVKVVLAWVMRLFRLKSLESKVMIKSEFICVPKKGVKVQISSRSADNL